MADVLSLKEALLGMCYKEVEPGKWLKPVGWMCFCFDEKHSRWLNAFKSVPGETRVWNSAQLKEGDEPLYFLKHQECYSRTDYDGSVSSFEVFSWRDRVNAILGG